MSILRYLSDKLDPRYLAPSNLVRGLQSIAQPNQLHMHNTEFSAWSVRADRRRGERRKHNATSAYLDTRCNPTRRNSTGRRWVDNRGQGSESPDTVGIDIYV